MQVSPVGVSGAAVGIDICRVMCDGDCGTSPTGPTRSNEVCEASAACVAPRVALHSAERTDESCEGVLLTTSNQASTNLPNMSNIPNKSGARGGVVVCVCVCVCVSVRVGVVVW